MQTGGLSIFGVSGIPDISRGDNLAEIIGSRAALADYDVLVVTQKIVSKAEGRVVRLGDGISGVAPESGEGALTEEEKLAALAGAKEKIVLSESVRILRRRGSLIIAETRHGFICANAGVDLSNVESGHAVLLPVDPDYSAARIRAGIGHLFAKKVGVIVTDTFGRVWRQGLVDVAIGVSGIGAVNDLCGTEDAYGNVLHATKVCVADELAAAANLVMGKADKVPAAVIRGLNRDLFRDSSVKEEIIRPHREDLFL